jgi:hypothetical protein
MAALVSGVTQTMLGVSFVPDASGRSLDSLVWRTAVLPIPGKQPLTVGLSTDQVGCQQLSAAMFGCARDAVD